MLETIDSPARLRHMSLGQLEQLARELRQLVIRTVASNGGHLAPSLGVVELTLALHSVFQCPQDKIIWDVGHQAYVHKILTGRRERFGTLRKKGGITGFPKRAESECDAFGVGHSSTSISAALGMALARDLDHGDGHVIAVLGDGAFTGGEAFEAMNNAGALQSRLIVVLNDNERSIDKNVGALSEYLSRIRLMPRYVRAKKDMERLLQRIPRIGGQMLRTVNDIKNGVKSVLAPGAFFEELGFHYMGPLDGHDISLLRAAFLQARQAEKPILVHVHTKKGKGYPPAEADPGTFHGIGKFDVATGKPIREEGAPPSYTSVFGKALVELAEEDPRIVAITAAMPSGTGLSAFGSKYPDRFFDVGIAEQHAVTMAAGMAACGKRPVVAIYSTFAQRSFDQLVHDVCLQNLPVTLCLDRAGLVGEDGPTHHGVFDLSYLRQMPNMMVLAPKDEEELRQMLFFALQQEGPVALRYPRGAGLGVDLTKGFSGIPKGRAEVIRREGAVGILAVGSMVDTARKAGNLLGEKGIGTAVANMRFVKPLDEDLLLHWAMEKRLLVTMEENVLSGGFGSAVTECLADAGILVPVLRIGIGDFFVEQGTRKELLELCGMTAEQVAAKVEAKYLELGRSGHEEAGKTGHHREPEHKRKAPDGIGAFGEVQPEAAAVQRTENDQ